MHGDVRGLVDDHVPRLVVMLHNHPWYIVISIQSLSGRIVINIVFNSPSPIVDVGINESASAEGGGR